MYHRVRDPGQEPAARPVTATAVTRLSADLRASAGTRKALAAGQDHAVTRAGDRTLPDAPGRRAAGRTATAAGRAAAMAASVTDPTVVTVAGRAAAMAASGPDATTAATAAGRVAATAASAMRAAAAAQNSAVTAKATDPAPGPVARADGRTRAATERVAARAFAGARKATAAASARAFAGARTGTAAGSAAPLAGGGTGTRRSSGGARGTRLRA